jgi:tRNA (mo5U34)-methyltransferase
MSDLSEVVSARARSLGRSIVGRAGYEVHKRDKFYSLERSEPSRAGLGSPPPLAVDPIWPLPCGDTSALQALGDATSRFPEWHYCFEFDGGWSTAKQAGGHIRVQPPDRALQRFRHFVPDLVQASGGSLDGLRVLDIACNAGFWSLQLALLGATVVGFDARPELVEQANLVQAAVGTVNSEYRLLDFWEATPDVFGGTFDVVLNLGLLYHLPEPIEALKRTLALSHSLVVLDTTTVPLRDTLVKLAWEEADNVEDAAETGIVAIPTPSAIELMFRHLGVSDFRLLPLRTAMPPDYESGARTSWVVRV